MINLAAATTAPLVPYPASLILDSNILSNNSASSSVYLLQGRYCLLLLNSIGCIKSVTVILNVFLFQSYNLTVILVVPTFNPLIVSPSIEIILSSSI